MQITKTLHEKAEQLVADGNVTRVKNRAYIVLGSSGKFYSVWLADAEQVFGNCECPATTSVCSHLLAAAIFHLANPVEESPKSDLDPFRGVL